jgi:hypothetical protein
MRPSCSNNLPVALEAFGEARGNAAFTEAHMRKLCCDACLLYECSLPVRNPMRKLYVIRKPPCCYAVSQSAVTIHFQGNALSSIVNLNLEIERLGQL